MTRALAAPAAVVLALSLAPAATARTQAAQWGGVSASFSYHGKYPQYSRETITIARDGKTVYHAPVNAPLCGGACAPSGSPGHPPSLGIVDLQQPGSHDVVLQLYSGGAHCCSIDEVYWFDQSANTYRANGWNFGDPGAVMVDLGHNRHDEFRTADDTFAYAFTDYAASGLPIQILSFSDDRFDNVTRSYPRQIAADAKQWLHAFDSMANGGYKDSVGVIAAWAADEALLGRQASAEHFLAQQAKAGHLNSVLYSHQGGEKFIAALNRLLARDGYARTSHPVNLHPLAAAPAHPAAVPACGTADLRAQIEQGSPGAGQRYAMLVLTNRSHHSCHTYGYVGMQLLDGHGGALPTDAVRDHSLAPQRVVLAPGEQAYAQLHWSVVPGTGDSGAPCFSAPARVQITPPDAYTQLTIRWAGGTVCEHGRIDVQPLVAGGCGGYMSRDLSLPPADRARPGTRARRAEVASGSAVAS
jgi:hypothetical protein